MPLRVKVGAEKALLPFREGMTGKEVIERLTRQGLRATSLYLDDFKLDLDTALSDLGVADATELEARSDGGLRLLCKIACGEAPFEVQVVPGETAAQVGQRLKDDHRHGEALCCQLFTDQMPLPPDAALDTLGLRDGDRIYPVFLPLHLEADLMGCLKGVQIEQAYATSPFWEAPVKQKPAAQTTFLCTLNALRIFWMHDIVGFPQFLHRLAQLIGFPPAFIALKHMWDGTFINAEKQALALGFYHLCRQLLPKAVVPADDTVFLHFPVVLSAVLHSTTFVTEVMEQLFEDVPLCSSVTTERVTEVAFVEDPLTKAVLLLEDRETLLSTPLEDRRGRFGRQYQDCEVITHPALSQLLAVFHEKEMDWPFYSVCTTRWALGTLFVNPPAWTAEEYAANKDVLCKAKHLHFFCFVRPADISRQKAHFLTMSSNETCVYVKESVKGPTGNEYNVFNPLDIGAGVMGKGAMLAAAKFNALTLPTIDEGYADSRPVEESVLVLLDDSGSMSEKVFSGDDISTHSAAVALFGAFADKIISFRFPFAVGLASFSDDYTPHLPLCRGIDQFVKTLDNVKMQGGMTKMWDAVNQAATALEQFAASQRLFLAKSHTLRILLLSDGEENSSQCDPLEVLQRLQRLNIVVDTIAIRRCATDTAPEMCALSAATGGHAAIVTSHAGGTQIFESEAFIACHERLARPTLPAATAADLARLLVAGFTTAPQRQLPLLLGTEAVRSESAASTAPKPRTATLRAKRLHQEFVSICHRPVQGFDVFTSKEDIGFWKIVLTGPAGSLYHGGYWLLYASFPEKYPLQPPEVRFVTRIFHCNINDEGRICHEVLTTRWSPTALMADVLREVNDLLITPNADDALDSTKAELYKQNRPEYDRQAKAWRMAHAGKQKAEFFAEHKLVSEVI